MDMMQSIVLIPRDRIRRGERLFRKLDDNKMQDLVASIDQYGVLTPLLVERNGNGSYNLLSGYNRLDAAEKLSISELPCIVTPGKKRVAATFDTDLFRRHMEEQEQNHMMGIRGKHEQTDRATGLIDEFKDIGQYLPSVTLQYLMDIPLEEQKRIYRALPQQVVEDTRRVKELEKKLEQYDRVINNLGSEKEKAQEQLLHLKGIKEQYETLKKTKQQELEKLAAQKATQLEKEYQESDSAVVTAVEKERLRVTKELQGEIENAQQHARELSLNVAEKNSEIALLNERIKTMQEGQADAKREAAKAVQTTKWYEKMVSSVAHPNTIAERGRIVVKELDQIRNAIMAIGTEPFQTEQGAKAGVNTTMCQVITLADEIKKVIAMTPAGQAGLSQ